MKIIKKNEILKIKHAEKMLSFRLKKALTIIQQYNLREKRILFTGLPRKLVKKFKTFANIKKNNHLFMPSKIWINGLITNSSACFYSQVIKKKKYRRLKFFLKFNKKIDLIVILDSTHNYDVLKEGASRNTPVIIFDKKQNALTTNNEQHLIQVDYKVKSKKNIIYALLFAVLQKMPKKKTVKNKYHNKTFYQKRWVNKPFLKKQK